MLGEDSNKLSYSALQIFKKSLHGFLFLSCRDNSISIFLLNLLHARAAILCPSYISEYLKKDNRVPIIPVKILKPPTTAVKPFW